MQQKFFAIPARWPEEVEQELNQFCREVRVLKLERQLIADGAASYWAVVVEYIAGQAQGDNSKKSKVDYREVLSESDFALFAKLRELRKQVAASTVAPVYTVFTNEQLAEMAVSKASTAAQLSALPGVGPAKVAKYGQAFLEVIQQYLRESTQQGGRG